MLKIILTITSLMVSGIYAQETSNATPKNMEKKWGIGVKIGTTGLEGELVHLSNETFQLRMGLAGFTHVRRNLSTKTLEIQNLDLRLLMGKFLADWYFLKNGFRVTGGLILNGSRINFEKNLSNQNVVIGGVSVNTGPNAGIAYVRYKYRALAYYLGLGYDSNKEKGWSWTVDAGFLMMGKPKARIRTTAISPALHDASVDYFSNLFKEHKWLKTYPVVSIGVRYIF